MKKRVITETDKSSKLAIVSMDAYLQMGQVHTEKDREIDQQEVDSRERLLNGHVSMFLKLTNMGQNWDHEDRMRESHIQHSGYVAPMPMSLLVKDHKDPEGGLHKTRAVVSGNEGVGAPFSNLSSEIIEPLADEVMDKLEVNSTGDFMSRVDSANEKLAREWTPEDEVGILGFDVKNLFGSMSARQTARVVRDAYIGSEMKVEGVDYESAAMYVRYGNSDAEIRAQKLARVVPVRRHTRGRAPGVTSAESLHADHNKQEDKWVFPNVEYTETEKRLLIGAVLEIAVRTVWENSCYSFGGRYYHQQQGGPTGRRITMAAARIIVGYNIGKEVTDMLLSSTFISFTIIFSTCLIQLLISS